MRVVTLLTDFGTADPYAAIMKGVILSINPAVRIVDVTHDVGAQDIREAAFLIPEYYPFFEKGAVHVAVVDPTVGSGRRPLVVAADGHFFVGPDNGIFSLILQAPWEAFEITDARYMLDTVSATFHGRDVFAPVAAHLSLGLPPDGLGKRVDDPIRLDGLFPEVLNDELYGRVIRFDRFGNAITNISEEAFRAFAGDRPYAVTLGRITFHRLSRTYSEAEAACIVGSSGYLEFAVFGQSYREEHGVWKDDEVVVRLR